MTNAHPSHGSKLAVTCRFLKHGLPISRFQEHDLKGNFVKNSDVRIQESEQMYEKYGKKAMVLGWHEIRQLLFEYLPPGSVEFDKQVHC